MQYKLSKFSFVYQRQGVVAFYHALNMNIIYLRKSLAQLILKYFNKDFTYDICSLNDVKELNNREKENIKNLLKKLIQLGILITNNKQDYQILKFYRKKLQETNKIKTLYLSLTYRCNLACKYCISNAVIRNQSANQELDMSTETAKRVINYFLKHVDKKGDKEMVLYGGEPLINWPVLKILVKYLRERENLMVKKYHQYKPSRIILCTNGTLITKEIAVFLKCNNIYPAVTLDGNATIHNKARIKINGSPTYKRVVQNYRLLEKLNFPIGLTLTLGRHNYRFLPKIIKFFADNFHMETMATNIMINVTRAPNPYVVSGQKLTPVLISAFKTARQNGVYLVKYVTDNRVKPFVEQIPRLKGCTGTGRRIMVLPDGKLASCMAFASQARVNVYANPPLSAFINEGLKLYSPLYLPHCLNCSAMGVCGGGCPYNSYRKFGRLDSADLDTCYISKKFLEWLIWDLFYFINKKRRENLSGFVVPLRSERRKIYGKIKVYSQPLDFQYSPNISH